MYIDTHCHFDALEFDKDRHQIYQELEKHSIYLFCMNVETLNFNKVIELSKLKNIYFCLGIHPLYSKNCSQKDIQILQEYIKHNLNNPKFLGIGEIGLDGISDIDFKQQIFIYEQQLKLAKQFDLPVFLHIRKAQDQVLKYLRQYDITKGIAHAFNGSFQQANNYINQGFKLGFGGNITFERALNIRKLAAEIDIANIVLETDAPDMSPSWDYKQRNTPLNIIKIAEVMCDLKQINLEDLNKSINKNITDLFSKIIF